MVLPFNLNGAIQEVRNSESNKELMESLSRFSEEFYKSLGIILYSRYLSTIEDSNTDFSIDILNLVDDYFERPSFESWNRLGKLCVEKLLISGDRFAIEIGNIAKRELEGDNNTNAQEILKEINNLRSNHSYKPPKKMQIQHVLEAMRLLRNFRSHEWDNNLILQPLVDTGVDKFIINIVEEIFNDFNIYIVKPHTIKKGYVETFVCKNGEKYKQNFELKDEIIPSLEETFIVYYQDEKPFSFSSKAILYNYEENRIFVYTSYRKEKAIFENVPIVGNLQKTTIEYKNLRDIFNIPNKKFATQQLETLEQKFGKILIKNDIIHNLPKRLDYYVHRDEMEKKLIEKLSHKRLYITTLDGGGGFGKTELAKEVIWSIIEGDFKHSLPSQLDFKYVIWVTGKVEYFKEGSIDFKEQSFNTLEDLLDSILYTTRQYNLIDETIEQKRNHVIEILNNSPSTILILDNLETVSEKDLVWDFLIQLGDEIETNVKILITSRTRGGYADQRLNIRAMKSEEANKLIIQEMKRFDVSSHYLEKKLIQKIIDLTGSIPLLIRYFVSLLAHGYNVDEMMKKMPIGSENALNFICTYQWNELNKNSKKLLMGIAFNGGTLNFAQAKLLCNFIDDEFYDAKEELQDRSFLVDDTLINSKLTILPPISKYAKIKLEEYPEIEEDFNETQNFIKIPTSFELSNKIQTYLFTEDIALSQIFQRAELFIKRGAIDEAYQWFNQAVKRFPDNVLAWRSKGDFEYRYLKDDVQGKKSFKMAIELNKKDPVSYNSLAYWEYDRGKEYNRKSNIVKSIELNNKALGYSVDEDYSKKIKVFIASALMKLAYITRDESYRSHNQKEKWELLSRTDKYFFQVIDLLENNLYQKATENYQEIHHNSIAYNLLANAHLMLGGRNAPKRKYYDLKAISYLISGLKFDVSNSQLLYTLGHPGVKNNLKQFNIIYDYPNDNVIRDLFNIENQTLDMIDHLS